MEAIISILIEFLIGGIGAFIRWFFTGCKRSYREILKDNLFLNVCLGIIPLAIIITYISYQN